MIEKKDLNVSRQPGSLEAFLLIREVSWDLMLCPQGSFDVRFRIAIVSDFFHLICLFFSQFIFS